MVLGSSNAGIRTANNFWWYRESRFAAVWVPSRRTVRHMRLLKGSTVYEITPSKNKIDALQSCRPEPAAITWGLSVNLVFICQPTPGVWVGGGVGMSNPYPYPRKTHALIHGFPLSVVIPKTGTWLLHNKCYKGTWIYVPWLCLWCQKSQLSLEPLTLRKIIWMVLNYLHPRSVRMSH